MTVTDAITAAANGALMKADIDIGVLLLFFGVPDGKLAQPERRPERG
jgi:hypothetical protein